jgi:hypothetical protein
MRLRELQTWTEIAREKNMIVVTGKESDNLGALLGILKERTPVSRELDENIIKKIVKEEFASGIQAQQDKRAS